MDNSAKVGILKQRIKTLQSRFQDAVTECTEASNILESSPYKEDINVATVVAEVLFQTALAHANELKQLAIDSSRMLEELKTGCIPTQLEQKTVQRSHSDPVKTKMVSSGANGHLLLSVKTEPTSDDPPVKVELRQSLRSNDLRRMRQELFGIRKDVLTIPLEEFEGASCVVNEETHASSTKSVENRNGDQHPVGTSSTDRVSPSLLAHDSSHAVTRDPSVASPAGLAKFGGNGIETESPEEAYGNSSPDLFSLESNSSVSRTTGDSTVLEAGSSKSNRSIERVSKQETISPVEAANLDHQETNNAEDLDKTLTEESELPSTSATAKTSGAEACRNDERRTADVKTECGEEDTACSETNSHTSSDLLAPLNVNNSINTTQAGAENSNMTKSALNNKRQSKNSVRKACISREFVSSESSNDSDSDSHIGKVTIEANEDQASVMKISPEPISDSKPSTSSRENEGEGEERVLEEGEENMEDDDSSETSVTESSESDEDMDSPPLSHVSSSSSSSSVIINRRRKKRMKRLPSAKANFFADSEEDSDSESDSSSASTSSDSNSQLPAGVRFDLKKRARKLKEMAASKSMLNRINSSDSDESPAKEEQMKEAVLRLPRVDTVMNLKGCESLLWDTIPSEVWRLLGHSSVPTAVHVQEYGDDDDSIDCEMSSTSDDSVSKYTRPVTMRSYQPGQKRRSKFSSATKSKRRRISHTEGSWDSYGTSASESSSSSAFSGLGGCQVDSDVDDSDEETVRDSCAKAMLFQDSDSSDAAPEKVVKRVKVEKSSGSDSSDEAEEPKKMKKEPEEQKKKKEKEKRKAMQVPGMPSLSANARKRRRAARIGEEKRRGGRILNNLKAKSESDSDDFKSLQSADDSCSIETVSSDMSSDDDFHTKSNARLSRFHFLSSDDEDRISWKSSNSSTGISKPTNEVLKFALDDENDDDVVITKESSDLERVPSSQRRKNIRAIFKTKQLSISTQQAESQEKARKKRVKDSQSLYNDCFVKESQHSDVLKQLILEKKPLVEVDRKLVTFLMPHQAKAVQNIWLNLIENVKRFSNGDPGSGILVAHHMGLGKTLTAITFIHTLYCHQPLLKLRTFLVVAPKNVIMNWKRELKFWMNRSQQSGPRIFTIHSLAPDDRPDTLKHWHERGGVLIISYTLLTRMFHGPLTDEQKQQMSHSKRTIVETTHSCLFDPGPDIIVCDEGHFMKNRDTQLFRVMDSIRSSRRIVLTGTPMQNNLMEYYTMISFIKPGVLGTVKEFKNRFVNPIKNGQLAESSRRDVQIMKKRTFVLIKKIEGFLDRKDSAILEKDLPRKLQYVINVRLTAKQCEFYRAFLATLAGDIESLYEGGGEVALPRGSVSRMLQNRYIFQYICSHPVLLRYQRKGQKQKKDQPQFALTAAEAESQGTEAERAACVEAADALAKARWWVDLLKDDMAWNATLSNKLVLLLRLIDASSDIGDKMVVFSSSVMALELIEKFLRAGHSKWPFEPRCKHYGDRWSRHRDYMVLTGKTKVEERQRSVELFNNESRSRLRLFLVSVKAGGVGMNLIGANRVVMFEPSWNPADESQAFGRAYRITQKKPVYIYRLVSSGTAEEHVYKQQVTKEKIALRVVDEQQQDRHYSLTELRNFYTFKHSPYTASAEPPWAPPADRLLGDVLRVFPECVVDYHIHENLLQNREEEQLTEEERVEAWKEYEEGMDYNQPFVQPPPPTNLEGLQHPAVANTFTSIGASLTSNLRSALRNQLPHSNIDTPEPFLGFPLPFAMPHLSLPIDVNNIPSSSHTSIVPNFAHYLSSTELSLTFKEDYKLCRKTVDETYPHLSPQQRHENAVELLRQSLAHAFHLSNS